MARSQVKLGNKSNDNIMPKNIHIYGPAIWRRVEKFKKFSV